MGGTIQHKPTIPSNNFQDIWCPHWSNIYWKQQDEMDLALNDHMVWMGDVALTQSH